MSAPVGLVSWSQTDEEWLAARRLGCGASDVAALLGFDSYRSPWQVWAEKTGHPLAPVRETSEAAELGLQLEPFLIGMARQFFDQSWRVARPPYRIYRHAEHLWRCCSPDATAWDDNSAVDRTDLVELKTAGLVSGRAHGWTDTTVPLGYELQVRWQLHVMDHAKVCHIVALVAGRGLCHYPIVRDMALEVQLVEQVGTWWQQHIVGGDEPALGGRDSAVVTALYPRVARKSVQLDDTDAMLHWQAYRDAHLDLSDAEARKAEAATALKALLGDAQLGLYDGRPIASWGERKGCIDWEAIARELYGLLSDTLAPDPIISAEALMLPKFEELAEQRRGPTGRTFTIKE